MGEITMATVVFSGPEVAVDARYHSSTKPSASLVCCQLTRATGSTTIVGFVDSHSTAVTDEPDDPLLTRKFPAE